MWVKLDQEKEGLMWSISLFVWCNLIPKNSKALAVRGEHPKMKDDVIASPFIGIEGRKHEKWIFSHYHSNLNFRKVKVSFTLLPCVLHLFNNS